VCIINFNLLSSCLKFLINQQFLSRNDVLSGADELARCIYLYMFLCIILYDTLIQAIYRPWAVNILIGKNACRQFNFALTRTGFDRQLFIYFDYLDNQFYINL
jgi:hypothetical protein